MASRETVRAGLVVAALTMMVIVPLASAEPIPVMTFGFTALDGSYDVGLHSFDVAASADTDGDVTSLVGASQTALFQHDFVATQADYRMTMDIANITETSATAIGSMRITDANGDGLIADLSGNWVRMGMFACFFGTLTNFQFDCVSQDQEFNGPSGGSCHMMNLPSMPQLQGAVMTLRTGVWFNTANSWRDQNTLVQGSIVPEPASVGLIVAGLALLRRRR